MRAVLFSLACAVVSGQIPPQYFFRLPAGHEMEQLRESVGRPKSNSSRMLIWKRNGLVGIGNALG